MLALDPSLTMGELQQRYPGARRALFQRYHLGGCASCGFRAEETLAEVCARSGGLPVAEVAAHILSSHEADEQLMISPREAHALLAARAARLVDVRTREEYEAVHVPESTFFTQAMLHELPGWDRTQLIIFMDHQGQRSMDAAAYFQGHGLAHVRALRGGIHAWSQEVDPSIAQYELEPA